MSFISAHIDSLDMITPDLFRYKGMNFPVNEKLRPKDIDALKDFEIRPTDVFIITFPKSGTVWMQQILSQIMEASHPGWAEDVTNRAQIPYLEGRTFDDPFRDRKEPRVVCTHLFPELLPHGVKEKQIKVVYVLRNPKDVLVSLYHFAHSWVLMDSPTSFEVFFKQFMDGKQFVGSWFAHVKQYVAAQEQLKIHIVWYEDMLKDLRGEVVKICAFLGEELTDEAIDRVVEASTFKSMKINPKANYKDLVETTVYTTATMRKGVAGDWKNHLTVSQNEHFEKVFREEMSEFPLISNIESLLQGTLWNSMANPTV
ncbi:amine sulfotransferase-like [Takifugu flavidus]|uniref:amine sulfotransferase-like n=1 Tax=Takifugu flavidus TaxID=433684 RepID=UPI002543FE32|nr:amine sulfotransferase-like [Takifugu flavidus]